MDTFREHVSESLREFELKVRRAERAEIVAFIRRRPDIAILELADAIAVGAHLRPAVAVDSRGAVTLAPVIGSDPRD